MDITIKRYHQDLCGNGKFCILTTVVVTCIYKGGKIHRTRCTLALILILYSNYVKCSNWGTRTYLCNFLWIYSHFQTKKFLKKFLKDGIIQILIDHYLRPHTKINFRWAAVAVACKGRGIRFPDHVLQYNSIAQISNNIMINYPCYHSPNLTYPIIELND